MPDLLIKGGLVIDSTGSRRADVAVTAGRIVAVEAEIAPAAGEQVLEADGCWVAPGLVDLHTHLRQPGFEEAETIESGSRAAALGGYTAVVAMPNTVPAIDDATVVAEIAQLAKSALCEVAVAGCITKGRHGEQLAAIGEMAALGVRLFTDDGAGVQDAALMRRALEYARGLGVTLAQHCEVASLSAGTCMHEGGWSSRLGLSGQPAAAEEVMLARDLALVRLTGARMHFLHLSTAGSAVLMAEAKAQGLPVTAEAAPHHFTLTDAEVASYDPVFKVNPPLRSDDDVAAVRNALASGVFDAVATDHAPHPPQAKDEPFDQAPPGMLGLETALSLSTEALGALGCEPQHILALCSWQPAAIAGLDQGQALAPGARANLCVFDPSATWSVDPGHQASRSRNTPYRGRTMTGRVRHTVFAGEAVVIDAEAQR